GDAADEARGQIAYSSADIMTFNVASSPQMTIYDGQVRVERNLSTCSLNIRGGCDLAEPFQMSSKDLPEGSLAVIDEENPGHLKLSARAYDTRVAGVVSGANGV